MRRVVFLLLVLVSASAFKVAPPFGTDGVSPQKVVAFRSALQQSTTDTQATTTTTTNEEKGKAEFLLQTTAVSDSQPLPFDSQDRLEAFFQNPEKINLLMTAGGARNSEILPTTPSLMDDWKAACQEVGASLPEESDSIMLVQTGGINFPGLKIKSMAIIGKRYLKEESKYEFVLIGDERTVSGLAPVVWIFNKLMGVDTNEKAANESRSPSSLTTINYSIQDKQVVFSSTTSFKISVKFPAVLLKILPTSKEKAEETGGKSLSRALEKDVKASMGAFEEAYLKDTSTQEKED